MVKVKLSDRLFVVPADDSRLEGCTYPKLAGLTRPRAKCRCLRSMMEDGLID